MDKNNPISEMMQESMAKIRELADTNTIVGQPIQTPDGVTLIPISRIHMGMGGGGTIFGKKREVNPEGNMGAGGTPGGPAAGGAALWAGPGAL